MKNLKKSKNKKIIILLSVVILIFVFWVVWGNLTLDVNTYTLESETLPESFDGFKIAHLSDLHDSIMIKDNEKLLSELKEFSPDVIAVTGDAVDSNRPDFEATALFFSEALKIAPCYYVWGNHEGWFDDDILESFENKLLEAGVVILRGDSVLIERGGEKIEILGIDDPVFASKKQMSYSSHMSAENIKSISKHDGYKILLSHRPQYFENYVDAGINLVLSGHVHGGQFRIPFIGGVYGPDQGFFPEYDSGIYEKNTTKMSVSRGLGNSVIPVRINNRAEIILIELKSIQ